MVSAAGADFVMEVCFFAFAVSLNFELKSCVSQIVEASLLCSCSFASAVFLFHSLVLNLIYDEMSAWGFCTTCIG